MPDDGDDPLLCKVRDRTRGGGGKDNVFFCFVSRSVFCFFKLHVGHNCHFDRRKHGRLNRAELEPVLVLIKAFPQIVFMGL